MADDAPGGTGQPAGVTVRAPLASACPRCGTTLATGASTCGSCGSLLTGGNPTEHTERMRTRLQAQIGDAYRLIELLGRGGMGIVFRAREVALDREVALKVLTIDPILAPDAYERFEREAKLAARLDHPNIVPIFAVGHQESVAFYTMRLVRAGSVEHLLEAGTPLAVEHAMAILREVAAALDYAHAHGVVHRDVKPANILIGDTGHAQVADFGIAKALGADSSAQTSTGVIGSPGYMAPEQWRGEQVDGRADQYALAIVAFEMLAARRPFETPNVQDLMKMHLTAEPPELARLRPGLPAAIEAALRRALAKNPSERFATATAFVDALAARTTGVNPSIRTGSRPPYRPAPRPRRRWRMLAVLALLAGLGAWAALDPLPRGHAERLARVTASESRAFIARQTGQDVAPDLGSAPAIPDGASVADSSLSTTGDSALADSSGTTASGDHTGLASGLPRRQPVAADTTTYGSEPAPFRAAPTVRFGFVRVVIRGGVARARVDGDTYGFTPAVVRIEPGVHYISVEGAGDAFLPSQITVTVTSGDTVTAEFTAPGLVKRQQPDTTKRQQPDTTPR